MELQEPQRKGRKSRRWQVGREQWEPMEATSPPWASGGGGAGDLDIFGVGENELRRETREWRGMRRESRGRSGRWNGNASVMDEEKEEK